MIKICIRWKTFDRHQQLPFFEMRDVRTYRPKVSSQNSLVARWTSVLPADRMRPDAHIQYKAADDADSTDSKSISAAAARLFSSWSRNPGLTRGLDKHCGVTGELKEKTE